MLMIKLLSFPFKKIKSLKPGKGKEIHITDAIQLLINDKEKFVAHNFESLTPSLSCLRKDCQDEISICHFNFCHDYPKEVFLIMN